MIGVIRALTSAGACSAEALHYWGFVVLGLCWGFAVLGLCCAGALQGWGFAGLGLCWGTIPSKGEGLRIVQGAHAVVSGQQADQMKHTSRVCSWLCYHSSLTWHLRVSNHRSVTVQVGAAGWISCTEFCSVKMWPQTCLALSCVLVLSDVTLLGWLLG